jgi:hypothetical protein
MDLVMLTTILFLLSIASSSHAQHQGILPGEPDPNEGTHNDRHGETLIDDRHACPQGTKRMPKMKCGTKGESLECDNYSPVLDCRKKPQMLNCKKPLVPVPIYQCTH